MDENMVFDAFRCCITDQKCMSQDCPYMNRCNIANVNKEQYVQIPKHLALDVLNQLKEQGKRKFLIDEQGNITPLPEIVRCKDCKYYPDGKGTTKWLPCREIIVPPKWFCADGERKDG